MPQLSASTDAPRLFSTAGTFGEIDLVASDRGVMLSLTGRNYDTTGYLHRSNALPILSLADTRRLSRLLHEAIAASVEWHTETAPLVKGNQAHQPPSRWKAPVMRVVNARPDPNGLGAQ